MSISTPRPAGPAPGTSPPNRLTRHGNLTTPSAWWFFVATFVLSWGIGALVVSFMDQVEAWLGPMGYTNPAFILMVYAPGFVGVFMVWRTRLPGSRRFGWPGSRCQGVIRLLSRMPVSPAVTPEPNALLMDWMPETAFPSPSTTQK